MVPPESPLRVKVLSAMSAADLDLQRYLGEQPQDAPWTVVDACPTREGEPGE